MRAGAIKNITICLLILVNIFLIINLSANGFYADRTPEQTISETVSLLASRGISIDSSIIPRTIYHTRELSGDRIPGFEKKAADALIGDAAASEPGGGITKYENMSGYAIFRRFGALEISLDISALNEKELLKRLKSAGLSGETLNSPDKEGTLQIRKTLNGLPVFNCMLEGKITQNGAEISGVFPLMQATPAYPMERAQGVCGLLAAFSADVSRLSLPVSQITNVEHGYYLSPQKGFAVIFLPVYKFSTDGGEYYFDAISGRMI